MYLVNKEEMGWLDNETIRHYSLPGMVLMEQASLRVVELLSSRLGGKLAGKRIIVFAGKGNNGGDGFAIARLLDNAGAYVTTFLVCQPEELKGDALNSYQVLQCFGGKIYSLTDEKDLQRVDISLMCADVIIDAIYGTGFKGSVTGLVADTINIINNSGVQVIAVDLPSGLEASTGKVAGPCIKAQATITFGLPKLGLLLEPGAGFVGELWWGDISLPRQLIEEANIKVRLLTGAACTARLPQRPVAGHKGTFGHVLALGGSEGMTGAITLAAYAALRSGAGLVTAAVPRSLHNIMEIKTTEIMTKPLPETEAMSIGQEALDNILALSAEADTLLLGPGMSQHPSTASLLKNLLPKLAKPLVLDADALNIIGSDHPKEFFGSLKAPVIITPHPGEMARLLGFSVQEVQDNRVWVAMEAAQEWQVVVVLKGAKTLVASPDGRLYVNVTGNAGMATGGSGDVLAGIVAALLGQGVEPLDAAMIAVYVHGLAGERGSRYKGQISLTAGDLLEQLPAVFMALGKGDCCLQPQINERLVRIL